MAQTYFATVARGLEAIAAKELERLGAENVEPAFLGVSFSGDLALLYRVNLWSRIVFRVLVPIAEIKASKAEELYESISKIDWFEYLQLDQSFAVNCTGSNRNLNHSHYTALQIKNAIVDQQRDRKGDRSNVDTNQPDIVINAHIHQQFCTLSLDSSGFSLHRRGYRPAMGLAPLKETLAAAILDIAEWTPDLPFLDPLCGSGTLPIEAGLQSLKIAPGQFHSYFCFQNWPDYNSELWNALLTEAKSHQLDQLSTPIYGSDLDSEMIEQALDNARSCGLENQIQFQQKAFEDIEAPCDRGILICNPPYGKRLGETAELEGFYKQMGDIFKQRFKGWTAYVLTGNKELAKRVGLKASRRFPIYNGSLA
ncbi:MAG: THUMP domain-containing class I SAM-dependent RNA methyltransferase, partial [Microcystaceae cyanobacterium]